MIHFGIFRILSKDIPVRRRFPWAKASIVLIPLALWAGMRTQVAIAPIPAAAPEATISLDCGKDGSINLDMGGAFIDGDHVIAALKHAAEIVCSKGKS